MSRLITDEMIDEVAVSGTYEIIVQKLRQRYEGLLDRVSLYQPYELMVDEERLRKVVIKFN